LYNAGKNTAKAEHVKQIQGSIQREQWSQCLPVNASKASRKVDIMEKSFDNSDFITASANPGNMSKRFSAI
jgi:hypothetical protein